MPMVILLGFCLISSITLLNKRKSKLNMSFAALTLTALSLTVYIQGNKTYDRILTTTMEQSAAKSKKPDDLYLMYSSSYWMHREYLDITKSKFSSETDFIAKFNEYNKSKI